MMQHKQQLSKKVLLTRPMILEYEIYVFKFYLEILNFVKATMTRNKSTLEEDLDLLEEGPDRPVMGFTLRMAIMYRSEKKKII
jgi:hypothetical protein